MRTLVTLSAALLVIACEGGAASTADTVPASEGVGSGSDLAPTAAADVADMPTDPGATWIHVAATVDGQRYEAEGSGECKHAGEASIYGVRSAMWLAQFYGGSDARSVALTLWRPKDGSADQLSLSLETSAGSSRIATVQGGERAGSGTASLALEGEGGVLMVEGRDAEGRAVKLEVKCARFTPLEAVGG